MFTASGCSKNNQPDWDDTLPTTVSESDSIINDIESEETTAPISLEMPDGETKVTTTVTNFATGASTDDYSATNTQKPLDAPTIPSNTETTSYFNSANSINSINSSVSQYQNQTAATSASNTLGVSIKSTAYASTAVPYVYGTPITRPYSYSFLSESQRSAYDLILNAIEKHKSSIDFPKSMKITSDDYCAVYQAIYNDENEIYYLDTQMQYVTNVRTDCVTQADLLYTYTEDEIDAMDSMIDLNAANIIAKIKSYMSDYDIVKLFYDELVKSCVYDETAYNSRDIYGCLVQKKAVCGGYAKAFSYLCNKVGIENLTITGDADSIPHMWNMVKLGGQWYHIDVTAGYVQNAVVPYVRYDYFCVDDSVINKNRTIYKQDYTYPKASAQNYNYFVYNNLQVNSWDSAEELIYNEIIRAAAEKRSDIQIRCTEDSFNDIAYMLFDKSSAKALDILDNAYNEVQNKYKVDSITYNRDPNTRVIKIFLVYT